MKIRDEAFLGKPITAFVVDAHTHISPYYANGWYQSPCETSNAAIINNLDRLGIDCIVTAPHSMILGMTAKANAVAAAAIKEYPNRIYGYISICPGGEMNEVKKQIKQYGSHSGFIGIKLLPGYHGKLNQPAYKYSADFANEAACPVLVHTWGNKPPLTEIDELAANHPRMKLLCAHQGGGTADLSSKLIDIMKNRSNLYMEICGSLSNTLSIEDMVRLAGEDRVIFGSDMINLDPRYDFGRVIFSPLTDIVKKKLLSENFLSLLKTSQMGQIIV